MNEPLHPDKDGAELELFSRVNRYDELNLGAYKKLYTVITFNLGGNLALISYGQTIAYWLPTTDLVKVY